MRYLMIFFILCASLFAAGSNIDEDTVHFIGQASVFTVGSNLVTNGDFASDSGWTKGTGWTTAGGDADCDGSAGSNTELLSTTAITTVTDTVYRVQFEVTVFSAGNIVAVFDSVEVGGDKSAVGVYTTYVAATDNSSTISLIGDSSFIGSCDNVSVVAWVGDLDAAGGCTISTFTGTLTDYMSATGGVLHNESGLALSNVGGDLTITAGSTWDTTPQVGSLVNLAFTDTGGGGTYPDGIYAVKTVNSTTFSIDLTAALEPSGDDVEVWIGGAFPDIATAINDSTLSQDGDNVYRKRYICVNVPMEVDAVSDFVAETSETALREDDGSRKLIGFYDSIEVVTAHSSYRVVSDQDKGQPYYGGALSAFHFSEGFPIDRPAAFTISELIENGGFDDDSVWALGDGWTIAGGVCSLSSQGSNTDISQTITPAIARGVLCRVTIDINAVAGGTVKVRVQGGVDVNFPLSVGTHVVYAIAGASGTTRVRTNSTGMTITIDNITITEVVTPGWVSWNAKGNDINILKLDTSNVKIRNIHFHNTIADASAEGLLRIGTANFNTSLINCWFSDSSRWMVDDAPATGNSVVDCYFDDSLDVVDMVDFPSTSFVNSIVNLGTKTNGLANANSCTFVSTLIYGGTIGLNLPINCSTINGILFDQTADCVLMDAAGQRLNVFYNTIFSPYAASDNAIDMTKGSLGPGFNNIMYSATAGAVLTVPIKHDQISPNPPLPVGTIEKDPLFVNAAQGDFRLRPESPVLNGAYGGGSIGLWQPFATPNADYRPRYNFKGIHYLDR